MQALIEALKSVVGSDAVLKGSEAATAHGGCTTGLSRAISALVFPSEASQVVSIVKLAHQHHVPIYPVSVGKNWGYGTHPVVDDCILLNLSRLNRILDGPDAVTGLVTIEPGVTQGDLAAYLDEKGLPYMVPTTGAGPTVSIMGNALERGHGITPIADHFAAVTGIEAVLADGSIYKSPFPALGASSGGHAFRWGIGPYLDGLFAQGSFGVVTKMTIALARQPESVKAFLCGVPTESGLEEAVTAVQAILSTLPGVVGGINIMNAHRVLAMAAPYPRDRLGPNQVIPPALLSELTKDYRVQPWTV